MDTIYVIVPVYNVEKYLERCLNSLLSQTYRNIQIILVNDGSTDSSPRICDSYSDEYSNIKVLHQKNIGLSGARNAGIEYVLNNKNEKECWLTFIDSDDYIHPNYIQYLYSACIEAHTEISICKYVRTFESEIPYPNIECKYEVLTPEDLWNKDRTNALIAVGKLYNVVCWEQERFPIGKIHEDEFTTYKVLFAQERLAFLPEIMYYYFQTEFSIMHQQWKPERLQGLDALTEQMTYFKNKGKNLAYYRSLEALCEHSIKHLRSIEVATPKYDSYKKETKKRMQKALSLFAKEKGYFDTFYFWYRFRIKNPIQKSFKNENKFSFLKRKIRQVYKRVFK